jgi:hypothetical protein
MPPDYRLISADSHIIEPPNLWLDYITPRYRERAPRLVHEPDTDVFYCEGVPLLSVGLAAAVNKPWSERRPEARFDEAMPRGAWDPDARLAAMAEDGLDAEIVYPTMTLRMFALEEGPSCTPASRPTTAGSPTSAAPTPSTSRPSA